MEKELLDGENVFVIRGFLSGEECDRLIARSEALGYEAAAVGEVFVPQVRNNARVILDDTDLAAELWDKARPFVTPNLGGWDAVGFNDRFRFYRYDAAEAFAPHYDGSVCLNQDESKLTYMVYLNEGCEGGETRFYYPGGTLKLKVRPERGTALVFLHLQLHEGAPVTSGRKYALRTDVMYRRPRTGKGAGAG